MRTKTLTRRLCLQHAIVLPLAAAFFPAHATATKHQVEVWKDPNCGCCEDWVSHLQKSGFVVRVFDEGNTAARKRFGIPDALGSCHTGSVGGYALEGHVPAKDVQRLLREKPQAIGLAVPGMPVGSPGMDGAIYQGRKDPFDVLLVLPGGGTRIYQSYVKGVAV
jgi:hypothetical protein